MPAREQLSQERKALAEQASVSPKTFYYSPETQAKPVKKSGDMDGAGIAKVHSLIGFHRGEIAELEKLVRV